MVTVNSTNLNNGKNFYDLVLSEIFEFAQAPSRDEFCDIIGYLSPTVMRQYSPDTWTLSNTLGLIQMFVEKNYAFRKYMVSASILMPSDRNFYFSEWQLKNTSRGRIPVSSPQMIEVAQILSRNIGDLSTLQAELSALEEKYLSLD